MYTAIPAPASMAANRKLLDVHARFYRLLESTQPCLLSYEPTVTSPADTRQLLADLSTLSIRLDELDALLSRTRRKIQQQTVEDEQRWNEWADALDQDGVRLWNRTAEVKSLAELRDDGAAAALAIEEQRVVAGGGGVDEGMDEANAWKKRKLNGPGDAVQVVGAVRRLAFGMIATGSPLETEKDEKALLRLLEIATKTISSLLSANDPDAANRVVEAASSFSTALESMHEGTSEDSGGLGTIKGAQRRSALVKFFAARSDCAWAASNVTAAIFNLKRALNTASAEGSESQGITVTVKERTLIATRLYEFARQTLFLRRNRQNSSHVAPEASELKRAVDWLTLALEVVDVPAIAAIDSEDGKSPIMSLKVKIVSLLAQACFDAAEALTGGVSASAETDEAKLLKARGERALDEALDIAPSEHLWRQKIKILRKRPDDRADLAEAYASLFKLMHYTEDNVMALLRSLNRITELAERVSILSRLFVCCLCLPDVEDRSLGEPVFHSILLTATTASIGSQKPPPHSSEQASIEKSWDPQNLSMLLEVCDKAIEESPHFRLSSSAAFSAQTIIWRQGDLGYAAGAFTTAASWFELGTHALFSGLSSSTSPKFARKAAISWARAGKWDEVDNVLRACNEGNAEWKGKRREDARRDAADELVRFFASVSQKDEAAASRNIERIVSNPNFNPSMLLFAAKQASDSGLKVLFSDILHRVLGVVSQSDGVLEGVDSMALLRCLIRSMLGRLNEQDPDVAACAPILIEYYRSVLLLAEKDGSGIVTQKDMTWFWKTAFNACVVHGCGAEPWPPELLYQLFDLTADLIVQAEKFLCSLADRKELAARKHHCRFASLTGKLTQAKARASSEAPEALHSLLPEVSQLKQTLLQAPYDERVGMMLSNLFVWSTDIYIANQDWKGLLTTIEDAVDAQMAAKAEALESIADSICFEGTCPLQAIAEAIKKLFEPISALRSQDPAQHARWTRLVLEVTLSHEDDLSALDALKHGLEVLRRDGANPVRSQAHYPSEERSWLLSKAWDRTLGLSAAGQYQSAKSWCEVVLELVPYTSDGPSHEGMIKRHYHGLLNRLQGSASNAGGSSTA